MSNKSRAEEAYDSQGRDGAFADNIYSGHDSFQNGTINPSDDCTIYVAEFGPGDNFKSSGFFTDQATVDSCIHNGSLDANELGSKCQTAPSNEHFDNDLGKLVKNDNDEYFQRTNVNAYDVDFGRLNELRESDNPKDNDLYNRLTNSDGLGNESGGIKCAYGSVEANPQFGVDGYQNGGGNQYYIDKDTFNDAKDAGVFKYNPDKSFNEDKYNLDRPAMSSDVGSKMKADADSNYNPSDTKTPAQINSETVSSSAGGFICSPDESYGYAHNNEKNDNVDQSQNNGNFDKVEDGRAPPYNDQDRIINNADDISGSDRNQLTEGHIEQAKAEAPQQQTGGSETPVKSEAPQQQTGESTTPAKTEAPQQTGGPETPVKSEVPQQQTGESTTPARTETTQQTGGPETSVKSEAPQQQTGESTTPAKTEAPQQQTGGPEMPAKTEGAQQQTGGPETPAKTEGAQQQTGRQETPAKTETPQQQTGGPETPAKTEGAQQQTGGPETPAKTEIPQQQTGGPETPAKTEGAQQQTGGPETPAKTETPKQQAGEHGTPAEMDAPIDSTGKDEGFKKPPLDDGMGI